MEEVSSIVMQLTFSLKNVTERRFELISAEPGTGSWGGQGSLQPPPAVIEAMTEVIWTHEGIGSKLAGSVVYTHSGVQTTIVWVMTKAFDAIPILATSILGANDFEVYEISQQERKEGESMQVIIVFIPILKKVPSE